jgi:hypothetical protein
MPSAIKQIVAHPGNARLTALRQSGEIVRQEPDHENVLRWRPVDTRELPARIAQVTIAMDGRLRVILATGALFEEVPPRGAEFIRHSTWREIETP